MSFCYVLKSIPFRDRDLIVNLFSEERGRFSAIARNGVHSRRFAGSLDLFTASNFEFDPRSVKIAEATDESLVQILSGQVKHSNEVLAKSFEKLSAASALNEIVLRTLPANKAAPELFKLYANTLLALEEVTHERALSIVNAFILKITQWLGAQPSLTRCMSCQKQLNEVSGEVVFPQSHKGAWLCVDCTPEKKHPISILVLVDALNSMIAPIRKIEFQASEADHVILLEMLETHLSIFVPGLDSEPIKSVKYLKNPMIEFLPPRNETKAHPLA